MCRGTKRWRAPWPKTHVVKWPVGTITEPRWPGTEVTPEDHFRFRTYYCAPCAERVCAYQATLGRDLRAYRYRRIADPR